MLTMVKGKMCKYQFSFKFMAVQMFCFRYLKSTNGTSDINNTVNIGRSRTHKVSFFIISLHNLIIFFNVVVYIFA